jgi:hypothetical protein
MWAVILGLCLVLLAGLSPGGAGAAASRAGEPAPASDLILDTAVGNDSDDALSLALASRGECRLLAVTITKPHPLAAAFTDAVNTLSLVR